MSGVEKVKRYQLSKMPSTQEPHIKLTGDRFKANKTKHIFTQCIIKLRKSLWLLVSCVQKVTGQTHGITIYTELLNMRRLLSQNVPETQTAREKRSIIALFLQSFLCIHCWQQDTGVDKPTSLIWNDYFHGFIYFNYILKKKFPTESQDLLGT